MGIFSKFERKVEDGVEGAASAFEKSALTPVQITKKAEKQMRREKVVGAGRQIAPTLYTCLVSPQDDAKLFGYYPTLAGEVETYLQAKAQDYGFSLDCKPLVRFVADPDLHKGKFDIIAELVAAPTIAELRAQENERYGISAKPKVARQQQRQQQFVQPNPPSQIPQQQQVQPQAVQVQQVTAQPSAQVSSDDQFAGLDVFADQMEYSNPAPVQPVSQAPQVPVVQQQVAQSQVAQVPVIQQPQIPQSQMPQMRVPQVPVVPATSAQVVPQRKEKNVFFYDEENDIAYSLTGASEKIGRESTNEIVVSDINASRTHAEIHMEPNGAWIISDLGSTNGLYVNGRRVNAAQLQDADIVLIGTTRLEFQDLRNQS